MKKTLLLLLVISLLSPLSSLHLYAESLSISDCKALARENYPLIKQYGLIEKSCDLTVSNAAKAWLPGVNITGFGAGFTDVLSMTDQQKMALGEMKNYMYGGSLMVNQVIYDGGAISANKKVARAKAEASEKQNDVNLYALNERIEQLYFGILTLDEQLKQIDLLLNDLSISEKQVKSLIQGGMANQSDLDAVSVRQVQAQQQKITLNTARKTYVGMLGYFIGKDLPEGVKLTTPFPITGEGPGLGATRPELSYYTAQTNLLSAQKKVLNSKLIPTVGLFGMATAHNKVMPLMKDAMVAGGLTLRWNIGALYTRKNDLANLETQRQQIETQRETFLFNNRLQQRQTNGTIENLREQMKLDDKALSLRESIRQKAEKKVQNGTETVNELLRDVNAVSEARQQKALHELQLLQEEYKLNTIIGK